MRLVKVGVASVKTNVGAVKSNVDRAIKIALEMGAADVTLGVLQEQLIGGYPPEDLVQWRAFVDAQRHELTRFAAATSALGTVFAIGLTVEREAHRYNCAAVVHRGRVLGVVPKEHLPTYNVFYEARTFSRGLPLMDATIWGGPDPAPPVGGVAPQATPGNRRDADHGVPFGDLLFRFDWGVLGVEVCEDIWSCDGPMRRRVYSGAEIIANVSASPFRIGVQATRREMIATRSADNQCVVAYTNAVGGQDGLIFDGSGFVVQNGRVLLETARFREGWDATVLDLDRTTRLRAENTTWREDDLRYEYGQARKIRVVAAGEPGADRAKLVYPTPAGGSFFLPAVGATAAPSPRTVFCEELLDALALGLGDYFEKCRFKQIGTALSGGRDSMLALLIAHRYVTRAGKKPADVMRAFYMPTRYSSTNTAKAAEQIARDLGVPFLVIPIEDAFKAELEACKSMLSPGEEVTPITLQNIQARIRAERMWNWSNSTGGLFLQCGNMSEKSVGYTTIGGDLEGGLSVISNLPKTVVIYLIEYLQEQTGHEGIRMVLSHPAGPELADNQEGEKELMPFPILDACFYLYAGEKLAPAEILVALRGIFPQVAAEGRGRLEKYVEFFHRMFTQSIYKWVQAPLGLHVGNLDLDRERALQLPVVESDEWVKAR